VLGHTQAPQDHCTVPTILGTSLLFATCSTAMHEEASKVKANHESLSRSKLLMNASCRRTATTVNGPP